MGANGLSPALGELWADWERRCAFVASDLAAVPGVGCASPEGGFYAWADVSRLGGSEEIARRLLDEARVAVIPGSAFGRSGEGCLRLTSVRPWAELREALARIRSVLTAIPIGADRGPA